MTVPGADGGRRTAGGPRWLWPGLGLLTVPAYNTWALWRPVNGQRAIFNGYLSEFSASDQPYSLVFRGGDLVTALAVLALALHVRARWAGRVAGRDRAEVGGTPRTSRWEAGAWLGLLLFAVSTFFDAFFAMDCSPTLSVVCRLAEDEGRLSGVHYAHTFTSVGAQTGIVTSMVAGYLGLARRGDPVPSAGRVRRATLVLSVLEVVGLVVMMTMLALDLSGLGYPQAVMVAVASFWFAAVGLGILEPRRRPGPVDQPAAVPDRTRA